MSRLIDIIFWTAIIISICYSIFLVGIYGARCIGDAWKDNEALCTFIHENF